MSPKVRDSGPTWTQPQRADQLPAAPDIDIAACEAFLDHVSWAPSPVIIASSCMFKSTGGGQRPAQQAKAFASRRRPVIYANEGETLRPDGNILFVGVHGFDMIVNALRDAEGLVIFGLETLQDVANRFGDGWVKIFDLMDDWEAYEQMGHSARTFHRRDYIRAMQTADVVTCSARKLVEIARGYGAQRTALVRNAGPSEPFVNEGEPAEFLPGEPSVVFLGSTWGKWLDWKAMRDLAEGLRDVGGVLNIVGGRDEGQMGEALPNVRWHGEKPWAEAMPYVAASDIGIVPFLDHAVCHSVDPIKLYDYVAGGCRVVATTSMWELYGREYCRIASPRRMLEAVLDEAEAGKIPSADIQEYCKLNSWAARCDEMAGALLQTDAATDYSARRLLSRTPHDWEG